MEAELVLAGAIGVAIGFVITVLSFELLTFWYTKRRRKKEYRPARADQFAPTEGVRVIR